MGIGLLGASAVSMAGTLSDLAFTGAQAVRQAFRLGVTVSEVSQNLHPAEANSTDSWAYVMANVSPDQVQKELDIVMQQEVCFASVALVHSFLSFFFFFLIHSR